MLSHERYGGVNVASELKREPALAAVCGGDWMEKPNFLD